MSDTESIPPFDITLLEDALGKTVEERFEEACALYDFYEAVTPYPYQPVAKTFNSFEEYEVWRRKQNDPRYW